ncbi:hypothetical protein RRF57_011332 [Xylaria bambusicola]|uniref:Uncharacterized protein n=1 Tax=Xylaria bambusicola TaxID=326684 RepID=A0AAN7UMN2_9PEZI
MQRVWKEEVVETAEKVSHISCCAGDGHPRKGTEAYAYDQNAQLEYQPGVSLACSVPRHQANNLKLDASTFLHNR